MQDYSREAMERVSQLHPEVAVVDVAMPELNGIEAAQAIRRACALSIPSG